MKNANDGPHVQGAVSGLASYVDDDASHGLRTVEVEVLDEFVAEYICASS